MSIQAMVLPALIGLGATLAALTVAAAAGKARRRATDARRERRLAEVRPSVLRMVGAGGPAPDTEAEGASWPAIEELAVSLLPKLRGADRAGLVELLERAGSIERARRRSSRPGAVGRARALELLGVSGVPRALPEVARGLRDRDPEVRAVAARALGKLGDPGAVPFLLGALEEPRPIPVSLIGMALAHIGPQASDGLRVGLSAPSPACRGLSAELLGHFDAVAAVPELVALLEHDPVLGVRVRAADALHRIGSPHALRALMGCLDASQAPPLRAAAARALSTVGPGAAQDDLLLALASGHHSVARAAAGTLSLGGPEAVRRLAAVAAGANAGSVEAIEALAALGHAELFSGVAA